MDRDLAIFAATEHPIDCCMSQTLKLYIPKVLSENKLVLLKGIGTLRINYRSAVIDQERSIITPPREEIYFIPADEPKIDPVLVRIVELIAQVDHEEAADLVYSFMKDLQVELRSNGILNFPNIGWIKQDQWGNLFFEPSSEYISINRFFGLYQVSLPEALTKAEQEVLADLKETVHEGARVARFENAQQPQRRWGFIIGMLALAVTALALFLFLPKSPITGDFTNTQENTEVSDPTSPLNESETQVDTKVEIPSSSVMPVFKNIGPNFLPKRKANEPIISFTDLDESSCIIIVGAFSEKVNVAKMIDRIQGFSYQSVVIEGPRLTKVGLKIDCQNDPTSELSWAKKEFDPSAWVYSKSL
jgi:hypothetical protein